MKFEDANFPEFSVKLNLKTAKSLIFDQASTKSNSSAENNSKNNKSTKSGKKADEKVQQKFDKAINSLKGVASSLDALNLFTGLSLRAPSQEEPSTKRKVEPD